MKKFRIKILDIKKYLYNLIIYLKQFNIKLRIKIFYYLTKAKMVNIKYI